MRVTWMIIPWALVGLSAGSLTAQSPVGEWTLNVEWPGGPTTVKLVLSDSAGVRSASWEGPQGRLTPGDVRWAQGEVRFTLPVEDQNGTARQLRFRADVTGDRLRGEIAVPSGRTFPATGERVAGASGSPGGSP